MSLMAPSHHPDPLAWLDDMPDFPPSGLVGDLSQLISASSSSQSTQSAQSPFSGSLTPLLANSSSHSPDDNDQHVSNDDGYASDSASSSSSSSGSSRSSSSSSPQSKKPRIELDSSQPLTAKGKPRARVYVACHECRSRKIRCDGAKPVCFNCKRRDASLTHCTYDAAPKRRGQDKVPGSRTRTALGKNSLRHIQPGPDADGQPRNLSSHPKRHHKLHFENILQGFDPAAFDPDDVESYRLPSPPPIVSPSMESEENEGGSEPAGNEQTIATTPSMQFTRETWWDALLVVYTDGLPPGDIAGATLSAEQRNMATQRIFTDVRAVLRASFPWASFLHLPRFFETILDPTRRQSIQPSLLIGMLSIGALVQGKGDGKHQERAFKLVDHAHSAIQASLTSNWLDIGLVQAAWFVAYFEVHGNRDFKDERCRSALLLLDSLIRLMALTYLDADHPQGRYNIFAVYQTDGAPSSPSQPPFLRTAPGPAPQGSSRAPGSNQIPRPLFDLAGSDDLARTAAESTPPVTSSCGCERYTLKQQWPTVSVVAPLWQSSAMWPQGEKVPEGELRKEEGRRIVWSSLMLTVNYDSVTLGPTVERNSLDLYIKNYNNISLLFPGESLRDTGVAPVRRNSAWNLCLRAMLLWHTSTRMRHGAGLDPQARTEYATNAWLEADAIEAALDAHSCNLESGTLYQAREYLFIARMCMSHEFQLFAPQVTSQGIMTLYREKTMTWLRTQMWICDWIWDNLHDANSVLMSRPLLTYWFISHVNRALLLHKLDPTLVYALEVGKAFARPIEYLIRVWPSIGTAQKWQEPRFRLVQACLEAGIPPPSVSFATPTPAPPPPSLSVHEPVAEDGTQSAS